MPGKSILPVWLGLALWPALAMAGDWPQFRGPNSDGLTAETTAPVAWGADRNVQWRVAIPGVAWSSPIVWGDKVFVTTAITDKQNKPRPDGGFPGLGPGGPGGRGPGGRGGFGGPPRPGQILPGFFHFVLNLNDDQTKQLDGLQKTVDERLEKILADEQNKQLKEEGNGGRGRRGPGGFGGFPQPGQVLAPSVQERLKLSDEQKQQIAELQKEVDGKLGKILNADQKKQLDDMRQGFGRGRPGGRGRGGFGPGAFGGGRPPDVLYRWEVYCLDRTTGKVLWKQLALEGKPRIPIQQNNTYATETPVTDGERVYAYFGMHGLYCYDLAGNLVWKRDLGAYPTAMGQGPASSPVLDGGRLFLQIDNEQKSFLAALDARTGDELWRQPRDERTNHSSPIVWKNRERTELVTCGSRKVRSYDPATGKLLWELSMGGGQCHASPVGDAEMLYVGSAAGFGGGDFGGPGGSGRGFSEAGGPGGEERGGRLPGDNGPGSFGAPPGGDGPGGFGGPPGGFPGAGGGGGGLFAVRAGASGDLTLKKGQSSNAGIAWSQPRGGPEEASPLVYQGYVYIVRKNGGLVTCYEAKTGKQVYRERIPGAKSFWSSPWAQGGKIFCLDDGGTTHVLQAGPTFKVLGKNSLGEMFWASPAIAGGAVILRSVDHLYCIASK
jgi:outer membrane protein assembly factor BamB